MKYREPLKLRLVLLALLGVCFLFQSAPEAFAGTPSVFDQTDYWFRDDDGSEACSPVPTCGGGEATGYGAGDTAVNTPITGVSVTGTFRIRLATQDTIPGDDKSRTFGEFCAGASCSNCITGSWVTITTTSAWQLVLSSNFADTDATTNLIGATPFVAGRMFETTNSGSNLNIDDNTEHEWNLQGNGALGGTEYYFRATDAGTPYSNYTNCAKLTTNAAPSIPQVPHLENTETPVNGVTDLTPEFSAIYDDDDTSDTASAYRIEVNTQSDFAGTVMWDSGTLSVAGLNGAPFNENERIPNVGCSGSSCISYAGTALDTDGSTFFWRIAFEDAVGDFGAVSDTQQFTMASGSGPCACSEFMIESQFMGGGELHILSEGTFE